MNKKYIISLLIVVSASLLLVAYVERVQVKRIFRNMPAKTQDPKVIFNGRGQYECDVAINGDTEKILRKVFIKNKMMRTEIVIGSILTPQTYTIEKDGYSYTWVPNYVAVEKEKVNPEYSSFNPKNHESIEKKEIGYPAYKCKWSDIPIDLFNIPTNESLNLPERQNMEVYDDATLRLLAEKSVSHSDTDKMFSMDLPESIVVETYNKSGHVYDNDNYNDNVSRMFGKKIIDIMSEIHFTAEAIPKKHLDMRGDTLTTSMESEYARNIEIEKTIPEIEVLKDEFQNIGVKRARIHFVYNSHPSQQDYSVDYWLENDTYVFHVSFKGPSQKTEDLAKKIISSFKY